MLSRTEHDVLLRDRFHNGVSFSSVRFEKKSGPSYREGLTKKACFGKIQRHHHDDVWKDGREVECAGLEIRYTVIPYRGFKSHSFRQVTDDPADEPESWLTQHRSTQIGIP